MTPPLPDTFLDEQKSLACVHCGLCLGACPTYLETGDENESPRGRIYLMRAMQSGRMPVEQGSIRHIDLCLGCRACEVACPSGVQYGALLEQTRNFIEDHHHRSPWQRILRRVAIEKVFPYPRRLRLALAPARLLKFTGLHRIFPRSLREPLNLIPETFSDSPTAEFFPAYQQPARGRIGFIRGCAMQVMFGRTNHATIELIRLAGYDVISPRMQGCCGALHAHGGRLDEARQLARQNIQAFADAKVERIVTNSAGCGSTLKEYEHLLEDDRLHDAAGFVEKVSDLTEFIIRSGLVDRLQPNEVELVTYHDACHLAHAQRITRQPREIIKRIAGAMFVELPESDLCCGSAGTYNLTEPAMAERLQNRKVQNVLGTKALKIVTTNPGCILQIQSGLRKQGSPAQVIHLAEYVLDRLKG